MSREKIKKIIIEFLGTIVGSAVMAFGVSSFLLPNQLSSGGIAGVATIIYYLFNIPMGITILIINIPLFFLGFFRVGKKFAVYSFINLILASIFGIFLKIDIYYSFFIIINNFFSFFSTILW